MLCLFEFTDEKISEKDTFECATKPCFGKKLSPNDFHHFYPPFPRGIQGDDRGIFVIIEAYVTTSISNIFWIDQSLVWP